MVLPSRRAFRTLRASGQWIPVAACWPLEGSAQDLFRAVDFSSPSLLLESARPHPVTGRYSFLVGEPFGFLSTQGRQIGLKTEQGVKRWQGDPLESLQDLLEARPALKLPGFPPFVGGAVGFLSFDAYRLMEPIPSHSPDDLGLPDLGFLFCNQAIVLDHLLQKLWVVVLTEPSGHPDRAYDQAVARIDALIHRATRSPEGLKVFDLRSAICNLQFQSSHTRVSFEAMVREAKEFIADGQIYQANLSQRFRFPLKEDPWRLYRRLTKINPSPFAAYGDFSPLLDGRHFRIVSASPERLLRARGRCVETRPIAGTRPKGASAVETARLRQELILNEKERAEHLMLVDLERNDLGRISRYGSVRVNEFMALEEYSHVIHIVSNVRGTLRPKVQASDLFKATFPGGTISGCPKIRALQIIDQLEPVRRAGYTGSLGYVSATGEMDFNLLIRTAFVVDSSVYVQAGAGIVADSDPSREYEETLHKAQALMEALHAGSHQTEQLVTA